MLLLQTIHPQKVRTWQHVALNHAAPVCIKLTKLGPNNKNQ